MQSSAYAGTRVYCVCLSDVHTVFMQCIVWHAVYVLWYAMTQFLVRIHYDVTLEKVPRTRYAYIN